MNAPKTTFEQWAIVEVMGHQRYIGKVTEQVIAGTGFVRVDVPETSRQPSWSKLLGTGSIYAITPVSETIARHLAEQAMKAPVAVYDLPESMRPQKAAAGLPSPDDDDDDHYDDEYY